MGDLAFGVFEDHAGGQSFGVFTALPHVQGIVSNLSDGDVDRRERLLRDEISRRRDMLTAARDDDAAGESGR